MQKILFATALVLVLIACQRSEEATTDTVTATSDTTVTSVAGPDATTSTPLSAGDEEFVNTAARGGMAEVQLSTNAAAHAANADVKNFANMMIKDHNAANQELTQIAARKNVPPPADLDPEHKKIDQELAGLHGAAFDKRYMAAMLADHQKAVAAFQNASTNAQDPDIRAFAAKTLPKLQEHLRMAESIAKKVGAK